MLRLIFDSEEHLCHAALLPANPLELVVKKEPTKLARERRRLRFFGPLGRARVPIPTRTVLQHPRRLARKLIIPPRQTAFRKFSNGSTLSIPMSLALAYTLEQRVRTVC